MVTFVDSHAHVCAGELGADLEGVLARAAAAGIAGIVCPGTTLESSRDAVSAAARHPSIRAAVGIHPHEASTAGGGELEEVERMAGSRGVVAIGEIGLDYHYDFAPRDTQRDVFRRQLDIARRRSLPVVIHSREAEGDTLAIVEEAVRADPSWTGRPGADPVARGVFHCFPGDASMARAVVDLGFYLSFPGPLTFPDRPNRPNTMASVARTAPLDRILLETDSPYLAPHPRRGTRNEPANLPVIAARLAELTDRTLEEIGRITSENAANLFGWRPGP